MKASIVLRSVSRKHVPGEGELGHPNMIGSLIVVSIDRELIAIWTKPNRAIFSFDADHLSLKKFINRFHGQSDFSVTTKRSFLHASHVDAHAFTPAETQNEIRNLSAPLCCTGMNSVASHVGLLFKAFRLSDRKERETRASLGFRGDGK